MNDENPQSGKTAEMLIFISHSSRDEAIACRVVQPWEGVRAYVNYKDSHNIEAADVSSACWLNTEDDIVNFEIGKTFCVIILARIITPPPSLPRHVAFCKERRRSTDFPYGDIVSTRIRDIPTSISTVEVTLIGEMVDLFRP